ncbi:TolC family protein [Vulgatibacter incomptus]|uniref:Outer membrane efflux protein n=1 Tax=Vulgatibacter incomptus TaxID=1391653 RepID=A0A0K1PFM7_9BACT|nr:TolC family protein [Vulgatibacter incomptus]AKU92338.1 outer membrane efflux protein [Vulgatibacter incomptus]
MNPLRMLAVPLLLAPLSAFGQQEPPSRVGNEEPGSPQIQGELGAPPILDIGETPPEVIPDSGAPVISLDELLQRAEATGGNQDLVVLRERLVQANESVTRAWSVLLPQVNAAVTYTRNQHEAVIPFPNFAAGFTQGTNPDGSASLTPNETLNIAIQKFNQWNAVGSASMPILLMPAYFGISAANLGVTATEQSITYARNQLILGITQAYYGAVASRRLIEVSYSQVQTQKEQERVAKAQFDVGQVPKVNFLRAAVSRAQAEQDLVRAQNAYVTTKLALQQLTGVAEPFDITTPAPVVAPDGSIDELIRVGLENRQDLAASRTSVDIANRVVKSYYWQYAPVISANGQYLWANTGGFSGQNTSWLAQVTASIKIFDGGARYADGRIARSQRRQAEAQAISNERSVVQDVQNGLLNLESARANLIKAEEQVRLATENADLVRSQYDAGAATYLDVVDAYNARFASQVQVVTNELNVQVASLELTRSIGKFGVQQFR